MSETLIKRIHSMSDEVVDLQRKLVAIPALGPDNDGDGEKEKADFLIDYLKGLGVEDIREINAPDDRVSCGYRPNIMAFIPGEDASRTFWIISHTDIVPPGDPSLWDSDPYELRVEGDSIIGRGVEDDHGGIVPSLILTKALLESGLTPPMNLGILLVADEETGSHKGLGYVVEEHDDLFGKNDLFLIPDFGTPDAALVEVAEKGMLWLEATVTGKQCHASTPSEGVNAMVAASALVLLLNSELPIKFPATDDLFSPPTSTFSPTKREANVPNINTIPGKDVFCMDCRILPEYSVQEVKDAIAALGKTIEDQYNVTIDYHEAQREEAAPSTSMTSEIVTRLAAGIKEFYGVDARPEGIGGGTVAAILRRAGHEAAVWSTCVHNAHQPNERSLISTQVSDAKVMARVLFG
ncbi:M20 family metallo-hydrolase [Desulfovibrio ferrophilus]|uniref:Acetylornithine deacetylase or succinyl-diaminopimelate desuccinylase n=1 Tax=Desulfovibrio ferrophilus TaxID=241368 RepID=A0A2Z6AWM1_9BACT|nr:M20 family metallo-hydrolase [Desulfovibrio ferrophilus]BBD07598.1 acetylornithine deacetylase or succinyl-diaminopimelate desuccinylase [Desulfovibrio ferrophilus]